ncbi:tetratricopeptide repeat protein [Candidatus Hydrogenedentota bacterium]
MLSSRHVRETVIFILVMTLFVVCSGVANAKILRFDCGTSDSPLMKGYERLTAGDKYSGQNGYGWETQSIRASVATAASITAAHSEVERKSDPKWMFRDWKTQIDDLNTDCISSSDDLVFRADVPDGVYRVTTVVGDMSQHIGSITLSINGDTVAENVAAWSPGSYGPGNHRRILTEPWGWWNPVRSTVKVTGGAIRIKLTKDQSFYDRMIAKQSVEEKAWEDSFSARGVRRPPYKRVGVKAAPYYYAGWPFVRNSIMAIEISPHRQGIVIGENDKLRATRRLDSPALAEAMAKFNKEDISGAVAALDEVDETDAQAAKAVVALWLAGRLETEFVEDEKLLALAIEILEEAVRDNPKENQLAELLNDAQIFEKAWETHKTRGDAAKDKSHFIENARAISWWWLIPEESPLYYQAQLHIGRSEHMLIPYFPARGTYREIFRKLEKKFPENRFVKYHLHEVWEPYGDGSDYYDWNMKDYTKLVQDSPDWVRAIYPAFQTQIDWSEWWIKFKQQPIGSIGGGWGDDVEVIGFFGLIGYVSRDISDILVQGMANLVEGVWFESEVDPELGFCLPLADAEHTAEWTGNTVGMMVMIDYGNPMWIERAMKTGKLMRDLWTGYNDKGMRHFRANFYSAAQIGSGDQMNDSFINYRGIRPASAVFAYNQNPTIRKLLLELADSWVADAMSTERGKPRGVIPGQVSFPEGILGGINSPNWWTGSHPPGTCNADWIGQGYKSYIQDLLLTAFKVTGDKKYIEPMRLEYELTVKYGNKPDDKTNVRLRPLRVPEEFGKRNYFTGKDLLKKKAKSLASSPDVEPGSEEWVAINEKNAAQWITAKRLLEGRKGKLKNTLTKEDIIRAGTWIQSESQWRWPINTTEASPTDRIGIHSGANPFLIYTGGRKGGPGYEAGITYDNTTRDFAAAVLAIDSQGFRLLYHSLAPDTREISIIPWKLETGGTYSLRYGPDKNNDDVMDSVTEEREFEFPQLGTIVRVTVEPRVTYVIEVDQVRKGQTTTLLPDPGLSSNDIRLTNGRLLARIHNVGSKAVRDVEVAAYDGDPAKRGKLIGRSIIPNIEAPLDLEPRTTTIGFNWKPTRAAHEIYIVVDPDDTIQNEITTFNNVAHTSLPKKKAKPEKGGRR